MNRTARRLAALCCGAALAALSMQGALAQTGGGFNNAVSIWGQDTNSTANCIVAPAPSGSLTCREAVALAPATHVQSTAYETSHVICPGPCTLNSIGVTADSTLQAAAYWLFVFDATSLPSPGTVTPALCFAAASSTPYGGTGPGLSIKFLVGVVAAVSTTPCGTLTTSAHAWFSGTETGQ